MQKAKLLKMQRKLSMVKVPMVEMLMPMLLVLKVLIPIVEVPMVLIPMVEVLMVLMPMVEVPVVPMVAACGVEVEEEALEAARRLYRACLLTQLTPLYCSKAMASFFPGVKRSWNPNDKTRILKSNQSRNL